MISTAIAACVLILISIFYLDNFSTASFFSRNFWAFEIRIRIFG